MKKIKYLLLFGILTLLGIGSSFAGISIGTSIDYYSDNGGLTSYNFAQRSTSQLTYGGFIYYNGNLFTNVVNYSPFYQKSGQPVSFNLSDYSLTSGLPRSYDLSYNNSTSSIFFDSDSNKLAFWLYYDYRGTQVSRFFPLSNGFSSLNSSNIVIGDGYYVRVFGDSSCLNTGTITSGTCSPNYVQVFTNSLYTYSSDGAYIDSQYNDVNYIKGAIAPGVYKGYSFGFVSGSGWQNGVIDTTNGDFFDFRYIDFNGNEIESYRGVYLTRLDSSYSVDSSNYNVLALGVTGSVEDFSLTYSIYNCPSNSFSISNCSFSFGGLTNYTGLNSSSLNTNTDFGKFIYLLTSPNSSRKISTSYNGNIINFFGDYYIGGQYNVSYSYNYNLSLSTVSDLDIIGPIPDGGGGNNNPGASYNSIPFSSLYYQCLGPTYNTPDGNPPAFCLNPDGTLINPDDYKDCFYNTTLSGGELVGHYFCDIGGYIQEMDWVSDGSGGYFTVCSSGDCGNYLISGPSFIQYGSGTSSLSTGLIEDMFTNITGRIAKCPFPYTDFQLGQNFGLIKYFKSIGFNFDPFVLINCVVAGFSEGRHAITNKAGLSFLTSPLISGDTDQHQALFLFLDFILILGIFGIISFLKKIF